jgi:hypothetical protein
MVRSIAAARMFCGHVGNTVPGLAVQVWQEVCSVEKARIDYPPTTDFILRVEVALHAVVF